MAQYIFVKTRSSIKSEKTLQELEQVCSLLTPVTIKGKSQDTVAVWPGVGNAFYAIQNSESVAKPEQGALVIGWVQESDRSKSHDYNSEANGSYAIIKNTKDEVSFFSDQFGSRTLWYYFDEDRLIVSTSQRAIVAMKGSFQLNEESLAWYLSSGCQGPFISWDQNIKQVLPNLEYSLNVSDWNFSSAQKSGMELPPSGSTKMSDYLDLYEKEVTASLDQVINSYPKEQVLLPLSGGLDSRLLLALSKNAGLDEKVSLVNWGVPNQQGVFDDKAAARCVAGFYGKNLLDMSLPTQVDSYNHVLDRFVEASEGRIDHFNAFADGFEMWTEFFQRGYRMIVRGDIPFTEGLDLDAVQARAHIGLNLFTDYSNTEDLHIKKYIELQGEYEITRLNGESLIRWRDRLYTSWRVPMVISAFSNQISGFTENRSPMLSWTLFKLYMGLPDKDKGNKIHIEKLWKKHDHSGVSTNAISSLRSLNSYFDSDNGRNYLLEKLKYLEESKFFSLGLVKSVHEIYSKQENKFPISGHTPVTQKARVWVSDNLPILIKAYLKSKQVKNLSTTTMAYRIVLAEKIISMYASDAKVIKVNS